MKRVDQLLKTGRWQGRYLLYGIQKSDEMNQYLEWMKPDFLFMDVAFSETQGIRLVEKMRKTNASTRVIFLSENWDCVTEVYGTEHSAYIRKKDLCRYLLPVMEWAVAADNYCRERYVFPTSKGVVLLDGDSIWYLERTTRKTIIKTVHSSYETSMTPREFMARRPKGFVQCHTSYVVNMSCIRVIESNHLLLCNGDNVPISRSHRARMKKVMDSLLENRKKFADFQKNKERK